MKILITGANGMLGRTLRQRLAGHELISTDLPETDITRLDDIRRLFAATRPDAMIHCAAFTNVDACETNQELAYAVNEIGSKNIASAAREYNVRLIAISTDYVFRGDASMPYSETDTPAPQTVYGKSKLAGEQAILQECPNAVIGRTAWLYGPGGPSFVHTMLKLAATHSTLKVVNDQHGNPTSTFALSAAIENILLHPELSGVFHLTCEGETTWHGFAVELFKQYQALHPEFVIPDVQPCTTAEYPRPAPRPANSRLLKTALARHNLPPMQKWQGALADFLRTL